MISRQRLCYSRLICFNILLAVVVLYFFSAPQSQLVSLFVPKPLIITLQFDAYAIACIYLLLHSSMLYDGPVRAGDDEANEIECSTCARLCCTPISTISNLFFLFFLPFGLLLLLLLLFCLFNFKTNQFFRRKIFGIVTTSTTLCRNKCRNYHCCV